MALSDGDVVVFAGDSITDAGRTVAPPLGNGYVRLVADAVDDDDKDVTWVNAGANGNTVCDLAARWTSDVAPHSPTWLVLFVGVNDLHVELPVEEFEAVYRSLVRQAVGAWDPGIVLVDPFFAAKPDDRADPYRRRMLDGIGRFCDAVHGLADEVGARHVPLHQIVQRELCRTPAFEVAPDAVHPTSLGCRLIADAVLEALGERPTRTRS